MKTIGYVVLAVLLVAALPCSAGAASISIRPDQFRPCDPSDPYNYQEPACAKGDGGEAEYFAVISLPVGRTITRLTFYHQGVAGSWSEVDLLRNQFREPEQYVTWVGAIVDTGGGVIERYTGTIDRPLVKSGYTYWVRVIVGHGNAVYGVRVHYE